MNIFNNDWIWFIFITLAYVLGIIIGNVLPIKYILHHGETRKVSTNKKQRNVCHHCNDPQE